MARMIMGYNPLQEDYVKAKKKNITWGILLLCSMFSGALLGPLFIVPFIISAIMCSKHSKSYQSLKAAIDGDKNMEKVCSLLPDTYTVLSNVELQSEGKTIYLDQVIAGPSGVYLLEVKNMNGYVEGHADSPQLTQHKTGRKGGQYKKQVRNPLKHLGGQVFHLSNFLKYYDSRVWVNGILYFSNPDASVDVNGSKFPIFTLSDGAKAFRNYIVGNEQSHTLSDTEMNRVVQLLSGKTV